jgi:protein-disulfide isomerase
MEQPEKAETPETTEATQTTEHTQDPATPEHTPQQNPFSLIVVGAVMLVIGVLVGYVGRPLVAGPANGSAAAGQETPAAANDSAPAAAQATDPPINEQPAAPATPSEADRQQFMQLLIEDTRHFRGNPDAPITMIEFSDFRCPFCARYATETEPRILSTYVDTGLVRLGYKHAAYQGEQSMWAAEASECAAEQDQFWPYYDHLIGLLAEGERDFTREKLKGYAEEIGLDTAAFNACMDSERYAELVLNETRNAQALGIRGTPTFLINGLPLVGAQPFVAFEQQIEPLLEE